MNVLTFDIEDWYCNCVWNDLDWNQYEFRLQPWVDNILDVLDEHGLKATFFCLGWVADHHPEVIRAIHARGHHIGCHSYQHRLLTDMDEKAFWEDTRMSKDALESVIGECVDAYRAPAWTIKKTNLWVLEALSDLGFKYDSSIFPAAHSFGGFPDFPRSGPTELILNQGSIKEFPVSMKSLCGKHIVFSGGGYFRFFPYYWVRRWMSDKTYNLCYFHTQDFDAEQPVAHDLPWERRFKTYFGIRGAFPKFCRLLKESSSFYDVRTADSYYDWSSNTFKIM